MSTKDEKLLICKRCGTEIIPIVWHNGRRGEACSCGFCEGKDESRYE